MGQHDAQRLSPADVGVRASEVLDAVGTVVVGKRDALQLVLAGILAGGHVLLEDLPGLGKTLTARCFAQALGLSFRRLQFTPDLLPADVTGSFLYDQRTHDFTFRAGPIFTNLLLADEINRTPPKTQAALLEAMQERQVSVEGTTYALQPPFHVLATANPIEHEGTYPLPEAQLDRFLLRVSFGYPTAEEEWGVLQRRLARRQEEAVLDAGRRRRACCWPCRRHSRTSRSRTRSGTTSSSLTTPTREHPQVLVGASPRGSLALLLLSRAMAAMAGRDFVVPEDVKKVAVAALAHRITLRPEMWLRRVDSSYVVVNRPRARAGPGQRGHAGARGTRAGPAVGARRPRLPRRRAGPGPGPGPDRCRPRSPPGGGRPGRWAGRSCSPACSCCSPWSWVGSTWSRSRCPFALGTAWALRERPERVPGLELEVPDRPGVGGWRGRAWSSGSPTSTRSDSTSSSCGSPTRRGSGSGTATVPTRSACRPGRRPTSPSPVRRCAGAGTWSARPRPTAWPATASCSAG